MKSTALITRWGLSVAILLLLLWLVDVEQVWNDLQHADLVPLVCAVLIVSSAHILRAMRWKHILVAAKTRISLSKLTVWTFAGSLLNFIMPGAVGGDAARAYLLKKQCGSLSKTLGSLILDRGLGLLTLLLLLPLSLWATRHAITLADFRPSQMLGTAIIVLMCIIGGGVLTVYFVRSHNSRRGLIGQLKLNASSWCHVIMKKFYDGLQTGRRYLETLSLQTKATLIVVSFIIHALFIFSDYLVVYALRIDVSILNVAALYVITSFASMVPVSANGLGIREGITVPFFLYLGNTPEEAILFSLLTYSVRFIASLPGVGFIPKLKAVP